MRILDITNNVPQKEDAYLFDANVWMFIFFRNARYNTSIVDAYEQFFERCEAVDAKIYLPFIIISEFTNVWLRLRFKQNVQIGTFHFNDYKGYRASQAGKAEARFVKAEIKKLRDAPNVILLSDDFAELDLNEIFSIENADINDNLIVAVAEKHHLTVVTHDADFKAYAGRVPILTANERLLSPI